eukprot:2434598-Prymnesium_polylepis.1
MQAAATAASSCCWHCGVAPALSAAFVETPARSPAPPSRSRPDPSPRIPCRLPRAARQPPASELETKFYEKRLLVLVAALAAPGSTGIVRSRQKCFTEARRGVFRRSWSLQVR